MLKIDIGRRQIWQLLNGPVEEIFWRVFGRQAWRWQTEHTGVSDFGRSESTAGHQ